MMTRMGRGGRGFKQHWHDRHLERADGDVLRWLVIDRRGFQARVACYRSDRRGGLHTSVGVELLRRHGHPDAELAQRTDSPSAGLTH
jgi:hypothetical protein